MKQTIFLFLLSAWSTFGFGQKLSQVDLENYKKALNEIFEEDQRVRKDKSLPDQKAAILALDKKIRNRLDELYKRYGFPEKTEFERKEMLVPLMVLLHSDDCDWNNRWVHIILKNYEEVTEYKGVVKYMFQRIYGSEMGICTQYSEEIKNLKNEYPQSVIEATGLDVLN